MSDLSARVQAALPTYEIGAQLGRGAFGVVLEGVQSLLGRRVAIKCLTAFGDSEPQMKRRFLVEAKVLSDFLHPHIVSVYEYVEVDDLCLLVMERLDGGSVRQRFARTGKDLASACSTAMVTCAALEYAHRRRVLHRDVKPENLLFASDGTLKITDFGVAKVLEAAESHTATEAFLGTPSYMAPEQVLGAKLGPGVDIYATATMLYELLSGQLPYPTDGGIMAVAHRHAQEEPAPLRLAAPELPPALAEVTMKALSRLPADRYQSAEEFGVAIAAAANASLEQSWFENSSIRLEVPGAILDEARRHRDGFLGAGGDQAISLETVWIQRPSTPPPEPDQGAPSETTNDTGQGAQSQTQELTTSPGQGVPPDGPAPRRWPRSRGAALLIGLVVVGALVLGSVVLGRRQPAASIPSVRPASPLAASGVVRIVNDSCDGGHYGTGFLIAPDLVATAAHVVGRSVALSLTTSDQQPHGGTIIGSDSATDVALIRLNHAVGGHVFTLSNAASQVGSGVGELWTATNKPPQVVQGTVSGLNQNAVIGGLTRSNLLKIAATPDPGSAGGPLLDKAGAVAGIVSPGDGGTHGTSYGLGTQKATGLFSQWEANPQLQASGGCTQASGPQAARALTVATASTSPDARPVTALLTKYFTAINSADYQGAYNLLGPDAKAAIDSGTFGATHQTSYDNNITVNSVSSAGGNGNLTAWVSFTSLQSAADGPNGDTCDTWSQDYFLIPDGSGGYLIDGTHGHASGPSSTTCG
jgi:serine/threonine protein kinase